MHKMEKKDDTYGSMEEQRRASEVHTTDQGNILDPDVLIRKAFEDDFDEGIETLYRWYYAPLCSHAIRFVSSKEIAEDLVSDVFCKLYLEKSVSHIRVSFRAYLFTWVRNRAFNYVKMEMGRNSSIENASLVSDSSGRQPDDITQFEDLYHDVEHVINAMPQRRKKIYIMHRMEGKKYDEISGELDISIKTVKEHMYQATQQVRNYLRKKWFPIVSVVLSSVEAVWNQI